MGFEGLYPRRIDMAAEQTLAGPGEMRDLPRYDFEGGNETIAWRRICDGVQMTRRMRSTASSRRGTSVV